MNDKTIPGLAGFKDQLQQDLQALRAIQSTVEGCFAQRGYSRIDTPVLEYADLFLRKSGGELAAQMYAFTDQGGHRVSLRPEFTASVIRVFVQNQASVAVPVRWQYAGPVFRYEPLEQYPYRQFIQQGVELIGATGVEADAEVVSLACAGLRELGITQTHLVMGHPGLILNLLDSLGLSERLKIYLMNSLAEFSRGTPGLESVKERLIDLGIRAGESTEGYLGGLLRNLSRSEAQAVVHGLLSGLRSEAAGSREPAEISARLLERLRGEDRAEQVERALALIEPLCQIKGEPSAALRQAKRLLSENGLDSTIVDELGELCRVLGEQGIEVEIDFSLARGLAYYNGIVFEISHELLPGQRALCGGGRYDGLVKVLGAKKDTPALGFAYTVEYLREALDKEKKQKVTTG